MTTLIQNWVCNKTGISLDLEHKDVGKKLFDGFIYYKLIEFMTPGKGNVKRLKFPINFPFEAMSNLELLCPWLKILGVNHSPLILQKISQCNNEACLRMLYEIYLRVEDRNHIYMVTKQRETHLLSKGENGFKVKRAPESQTDFVETKPTHSQLLEDPLLQSKPLVLKYKYRKEKLLKKCKQESARRARKLALLSNPKGINNEMRTKFTPPLPFSKDDRLKMCETKKQVNQTPEQKYLFQKKKQILNVERTKLKMFAAILQDLWRSFISNERDDFESIVKSKLLEQSSQEEQLAIKWMHLHTEYKNFFHQSIVTNDQTVRPESVQADIYAYQKVDEKKRLLELHCRLFDIAASNLEKEKLSLCSQTLIDLVDYSMLKSEYWQANEQDVPAYVEFLWKQLFYKGLPIELEVSNHFNVKSSYENEYKKIYCLLTKIPDALLDVVVDCYLKQEELWSTSKEPRSLNNFGYIIHKLLHIKYPLPPNVQPKNLPEFSIKTILTDVLDSFALQELRKILNAQSVELIDVNLFTNYCLNKFDEERMYYQLEFMENFSDIYELEGFVPRYGNTINKETQFPPAASEKPTHSYAGLLGKVAFEMLKEGESLDDVLLVAMLVEYLKTLEGKRGFVLAGYPITQYQILVFEYFIMGKPLKMKQKLDSNVGMNINSGILLYLDNIIRHCIEGKRRRKETGGQFSSTIGDFSSGCFEEEISEMTVKLEESDLEEYSIPQSQPSHNSDSAKRRNYVNTVDSEDITETTGGQWMYEDLETYRNSKILPNPLTDCHSIDGVTTTYIERYITICKRSHLIKPDRKLRKKDSYKKCKTPSQKTKFLKFSNITGKQIYEQFDKFTKIYIWDFDLETLSFISKIILDLDEDLAGKRTKQSDLSFSKYISIMNENYFHKTKDGLCEEVQYVLSPAYYDCKKLIGRPNEKSLDSEVEEPEIVDSMSYVEKPISQKLQLALASLWEQVEKSYLRKIKESLSKLLNIKFQWLPFRNYITQMTEQCMETVDERFQIVNNFQMMFNTVELFTRKNSTVKAELHFRVKELYDILFDLIERKKAHAESIKKEIEDTQWIINYTLLLANSYLRLLQHELDRTVDSLQIMVDYYTSMLGLIPDTRILPKIEIKQILFDEEPSTKRKSRASRSYSILTKKSLSSANDLSNDYNYYLSSGLNVIRSKVKSLQGFFNNIINLDKKSANTAGREESRVKDDDRVATSNKILSPPVVKDAKFTALKNKPRTTMSAVKSSSGKKSASMKKVSGSALHDERKMSSRTKSLKQREHAESEEHLIKNKIKMEWQNVVRTELDRLLDVVALVEEQATADIESAVQTVGYLYERFENNIQQQYCKELEALNDIKSVFSAAIEDEVPIQPLIIFDNEKFYIDKTNLLFEDSPPEPPMSIQEETNKYRFKISHLEKLVAKLQHISLNGIMLDRFSSILHSHLKSEDSPAAWRKLSKRQIDEILTLLYGRNDVVDWRAFVIFAINIPIPTVHVLVSLKTHFEQMDEEKYEIISKEKFYNTTLWFDKEFAPTLQGDLHFIMSKLLLQKLFEVSSLEMNYIQFLLFFCRSENTKEGFMKILEILSNQSNLGKKDCTVHQVVPVDAIIVAKQEIDSILSNALDIIDNIPVKTLPADYRNIFASNYNEYLETEMILAMNWLSPSKRSASVCYETDPHYKNVPAFEEYKNCLPLYERFREPIWFKCVHYKLAHTIFMLIMNLNLSPPDSLQRQHYLETILKDLYKEKGVNNYIQAYHLYESKCMQEIIETSFFFKTCKLDVLLEKYINSDISHPK